MHRSGPDVKTTSNRWVWRFINTRRQTALFPPGYSTSGSYVDGATDTSPGWGWAAFILPYMEAANLNNQIDFTQPAQNCQAVQVVLSFYICQADTVSTGPFTIPDSSGNPVALAAPSSYAACCGGDESDTADPTGLGIFYRNSQTQLSDITDGTSQTIMIGERSWMQARGTWSAAFSGGVCTRGQYDTTTENSGASTFPAPALVLAHSHLNNPDGDKDGSMDDFSSRHPGGANFLFADGSVHFLQSVPRDNPDGSYTPDSLIFQALGTRANGETIRGDWLQ